MPPLKQRELQSFMGIVDYLSKFSPMTAEVCETLLRLTSVKAEWTWNRTYQEIDKRAKSPVKEVCEIPWCQEATIPENSSIRSRSGHCTTACKGQPKLWIWLIARQCNAWDHHVCQQEPIQCGVIIHTHRKALKSSAWVGEGPPLLLCTWSTCHHRPQALGGNNW